MPFISMGECHSPLQITEHRWSDVCVLGVCALLSDDCMDEGKRMTFRRKILTLVGMFIFGYFCVGLSNPPQAGDAKAKWTCIIYFAGDNFLDWFVSQNLDELRKLDSNHNVRAVVLADKTDNRGYLYEVKKECLAEIPLWRIEQSWDGKELNTGDPQTLATFACWAVERFPAENYLLLLG
ncbi:MAG: hypothetical protein HYW14_05840, partial [Planctomycetes bacterium]|nr:hypothetical protein [Planctomycetota bacterium]